MATFARAFSTLNQKFWEVIFNLKAPTARVAPSVPERGLLPTKLLIYSTGLAVFLSSCVSYKIPTEAFKDTTSHPLYNIIPRHSSQIHPLDIGHWVTWTLFGNDDDGIFGEDPKACYCPEEPASLWKAMRWTCRNPFHNFCFYVIGSGNKPQDAFVILQISKKGCLFFRYLPNAATTFPQDVEEVSCFYLALHGKKPFLSFRLAGKKQMLEAYLGFRCRGNFGIKFLPFKMRKQYYVQHGKRKTTL